MVVGDGEWVERSFLENRRNNGVLDGRGKDYVVKSRSNSTGNGSQNSEGMGSRMQGGGLGKGHW